MPVRKLSWQCSIKGKAPAWVNEDFPSHYELGEDKEYMVGNDEVTLLCMASLGCIEMAPLVQQVGVL